MSDAARRDWVARALGVRFPDLAAAPPPRRARLAPIWRLAKEAVDDQLAAFEAAARATGMPIGTAIADHGIVGVLGRDYVGLMATLAEHDGGAGDIGQLRARLRAQASALRGTLAGSKAVALLEANPLGVPVMPRMILGTALEAIERQAASPRDAAPQDANL